MLSTGARAPAPGRMSQPMRSPHPGGGTGKLPMTESARREMQLMKALCWRETTTRPMTGCEQRGWKADRPVGLRGGAVSQRQRASARTLACCLRRRPPWPALPGSSPRWPRSSLPPLQAETPGPAKSVREGRGGVLSWGMLRGKRVLSRQQQGGGWGRQLSEAGVLWGGGGWRRGEGLRLGEEGDRSRHGADAEGGMGMYRGLPGAEESLRARAATDLAERSRSIEHLPWTRLFARCPDDGEDRVWAIVIHKSLLKAVWEVGTVLHSSFSDKTAQYREVSAKAVSTLI